mmetsp:Transcript_99457/g.287076  ORF Transcript_99457/g.287076 Transcript_99457/m.287076 type:complete len:306 (-) Transcript_99457:373-1290(-)
MWKPTPQGVHRVAGCRKQGPSPVAETSSGGLRHSGKMASVFATIVLVFAAKALPPRESSELTPKERRARSLRDRRERSTHGGAVASQALAAEVSGGHEIREGVLRSGNSAADPRGLQPMESEVRVLRCRRLLAAIRAHLVLRCPHRPSNLRVLRVLVLVLGGRRRDWQQQVRQRLRNYGRRQAQGGRAGHRQAGNAGSRLHGGADRGLRCLVLSVRLGARLGVRRWLPNALLPAATEESEGPRRLLPALRHLGGSVLDELHRLLRNHQRDLSAHGALGVKVVDGRQGAQELSPFNLAIVASELRG